MTDRATRSLRKYLERWAEPEAAVARELVGSYRCVLIVPVRDENATFVDGLRPALSAHSPTLLIVVVNSDAACAAEVQANNQRLLLALRNLGTSRAFGDSGCWHVNAGGYELLLVDRSTEGRQLPVKAGAGLARKIGCDIAAALWADGKLEQPWLFNTDADVLLPTDYFQAPQSDFPVSALLFAFRHEPSGDGEAVDAATAAYESWLRYYVVGLAWAGSPYAFHTVGSCLALHAQAYCLARGFPKRDAAEDFHLLAKMAKIAPLQRIDHVRVTIKSRLSSRTPVGTGARVGSLLEGKPLTFYNPKSFEVLSAVLHGLRQWAADPQRARLRAADFRLALPAGSFGIAGLGRSGDRYRI